MTTQGGKSRLREQAIVALLECASIAEAAARIGINERTLLRWLAEIEFKQKFSEARTSLLRAATNRLLLAGDGAAKTLTTISEDREAPSGSRVAAATKIIELGRGNFEVEELERRVSELEKNIGPED